MVNFKVKTDFKITTNQLGLGGVSISVPPAPGSNVFANGTFVFTSSANSEMFPLL